MIKNIAYFPLQCANNAPPVMAAFLKSCHSANIQPVQDSMDADAAVIWSVLWHGRMKANQRVYQHYRSHNRPVICIDIGALDRGRTWKIAINNITAQGFYGHDQNLDWDRPKKLGIAHRLVSKVKPQVLIAAQHPASLQLECVDQMVWFDQQIQSIRAVTDMPIVLRQHPRGKVDPTRMSHKVVNQPAKPVANTYDSFDIDYAYHAVINVNSGPGIQAALAGARVIVHHTSLAAPVSIQAVDIMQPAVGDRHQWVVEICHTEYTLAEIEQGLWLKRIGYKLEP